MKGTKSTEFGSISIDEHVIAKYAGLAALETMGIVGMAAQSMTDGLVKLLKRENVTQGVHVDIHDNECVIDFHIIIKYGVNITTISGNLIETVKYQIKEMTGLVVKKINIFVDGVRVID